MKTNDDWLNRPTLTLLEAAQVAGIGRSLAYAAARSGDIPTVKIGGKILVLTKPFAEKFGLQATIGKSAA